MQYFWIVSHDMVGDDLIVDKVFLQPKQAIEWGRREATRHQDYTYKLLRQPITRTGIVSFYKVLPPFKQKVPKVASVIPFDWDEFEVKRGADMDIDVIR